LTEVMVSGLQLIHGTEIRCDVPKYVCGNCEAAFMSPEQATRGVKLAVAEYQQAHGLLTAEKLKAYRKQRGLRTAELAQRSKLGEATIKRLEAGLTVQTPGTNRLLMDIFCPPDKADKEMMVWSISIDSKRCVADSTRMPRKYKRRMRFDGELGSVNRWNRPEVSNDLLVGV